jgi:hypothetical protein
MYYYETEIYNSTNEIFIGNSQGCVSSCESSYMALVGNTNRLTAIYPYDSYKNNIPTWLCSYNDNLQFENLFKNNYSEIDEELWNSDEWIECKYGSLDYFKNSIWNVNGVADVSNNKYMTIIKIYNSKYTEIINTGHYLCTYYLMIIFGIIFVLSLIYNLIKLIQYYINKPENINVVGAEITYINTNRDTNIIKRNSAMEQIVKTKITTITIGKDYDKINCIDLEEQR